MWWGSAGWAGLARRAYPRHPGSLRGCRHPAAFVSVAEHRRPARVELAQQNLGTRAARPTGATSWRAGDIGVMLTSPPERPPRGAGRGRRGRRQAHRPHRRRVGISPVTRWPRSSGRRRAGDVGCSATATAGHRSCQYTRRHRGRPAGRLSPTRWWFFSMCGRDRRAPFVAVLQDEAKATAPSRLSCHHAIDMA